jgi:hypothetical protein
VSCGDSTKPRASEQPAWLLCTRFGYSMPWTCAAGRVDFDGTTRSTSGSAVALRARTFPCAHHQYLCVSPSDILPQCFDWRKRVIASYTDETKVLEVSQRGYAILDQVCLPAQSLCNTHRSYHTTCIDRRHMPSSSLDVVIGLLVTFLYYVVYCVPLQYL